MLNPSELRIGNIVLESSSFTPSPDDFEEIVVGAINGIDKVVLDNQNNIYSYDYLYPIPLTPEWLERLGYVKDSTDKKWYRSPYVLPPVYCWRMGDYGMDGLPLSAKSFQHVHQLQNLYFALTGEELTIKN